MKKIIGFNYKYNSQEKEKSELIKEIGFDGVFIYSQYNPQNYIEDILGSGLEIETLHLSYKRLENGVCVDSRFVNNLWLDNDAQKIYLKTLLNEIDFAKAYGIRKVVMHITGGNTPPKMSQVGVDFIEKLLNYCENQKIELCLENLRCLSYLEFIYANLKSPYLKFCFDTGHANYMTKNAMEFPWGIYGRYLSCLHLNDNNGTKDSHSIPFKGSIDWNLLIKEICSWNSSINLTLEVRSNEFERENVSERRFLQDCYESLISIEGLMQSHF